MFEEEAKREDGIEAVSIATPNGTHYEICKAALNVGLHVVCEKPLCFTFEEAKELENLAKKKNRVVGITYG
ncbi:Gfo/Idh/MocA family protein, partial [Bacillus subtilis]